MSDDTKCPKCGAAVSRRKQYTYYACGSVADEKMQLFRIGRRCWEHQLTAMTARAEAAEAIVERLPKTKDGVPTVDGDVLFVLYVGTIWEGVYCSLGDYEPGEGYSGSDALYDKNGNGECLVDNFDWDCAYSTRQAAEAAMQEAK